MFKRANKITALLVTATSIMSVVPAMASDVEKINSEDGTIYNAVAYADGKSFVDGEVNDDEAAYYLADGDFTALDDVNSGDDAVVFGNKYIDVEDGDYTIDLDNGTVTDDDISKDTSDDAASALRKEIKKDTEDRYDESITDEIKEQEELAVIPGAKFGATWYATTYAAATGSTTNNSATSFNVYTDTDGNYIDADYNLGKIKVTTTAVGTTIDKTVTIENTNDTYDGANSKDDAVSAYVRNAEVIGQDDDYIYRTATATVKTTTAAALSISEINGLKLADIKGTSVFDTSVANQVSFKVIQKISKEQDSDDIDGANYAKTVTTYTLSDEDGEVLGGLDLLNNPNVKYTIVNGKVIVYVTNEDDENVTVRAYTLKSSNGFYYTDEEDESSENCEVSDDQGCAVEVDSDGNLWRLDSGYIYKFDNTNDWDKVYKVDGSFDEISVYNKDNIISWSEDDEVYSIVAGTNNNTTTDDTPIPVETTGWVQSTDGSWMYVNENGSNSTGWILDGSNWYYTNASGIMQIGWQYVGGTWYYLNPVSDGTKGAMKTGWIKDNGTWYYLNPVSDGTKGAMKTGWINDNGTWYYCNKSGAMLANTTVDGYKLGSSGAWIR